MTLVDTSIWRRHIRQPLPALAALLQARRAGAHPFVVGELACGTLKNRDSTLFDFAFLRQAPILPEVEVRHALEFYRLWGVGLSWIDVHILASAQAVGWRLFTADKAMISAAKRMRLRCVEDLLF